MKNRWINGLISALFCVSNGWIANAQTAKFLPYNGDNAKSATTEIVGTDQKGIYTLERSNKVYFLTKYDFKYNQIWSKNLELDEKDVTIEKTIIQNQQTKIFFSMYDGFGERHGLFCRIIDNQDHQKTLDQPTTIFDQQNIVSKSKSKFLVLNNNTSQLTATHEHQIYPDKQIITTQILDDSLQKINENTLVLLDADKTQNTILGYQIDSTNNLYTLTKTTDDTKRLNDPSRVAFNVHKIDLNTNQQTKIFKFVNDKFFINKAKITYDTQNHRILLAALYSEKNSTSNTSAGTVVVRIIPQTLEPENTSIQHFSQNFIVKLEGLKNIKKQKELANYDLKKLIARTDGGLIIVAESYYVTTQVYMQYNMGYAPMPRNVYYYHYDDIIVLSINPNGTTDWEQIVPKSQTYRDFDANASFALLQLKDRLAFIYNEDNGYQANVMQFDVSATGELLPSRIVNPEATAMTIQPQLAKQASQKTILIPAYKRKKKGILKLTYQ